METKAEYTIDESCSCEKNGECGCEENFVPQELTEMTVFDFEQFEKGATDASYWSGFYYQLTQVGMKDESIASIIITMMDHKYNSDTNKMNKDLSLTLAKIDTINKSKEVI